MWFSTYHLISFWGRYYIGHDRAATDSPPLLAQELYSQGSIYYLYYGLICVRIINYFVLTYISLILLRAFHTINFFVPFLSLSFLFFFLLFLFIISFYYLFSFFLYPGFSFYFCFGADCSRFCYEVV